MSMHINLSKQMKAYITSKVESGFYDNATEVIRDAVRRMQDEDAQFSAFKAAIEEGEADIAAGRVFKGTDTTIEDIAAEVLREKSVEGKTNKRG
jgi:antitoxin ParD1/3/4